jgi:hypothetical protein
MQRIQLLKSMDYWSQRKDTEAPGIECNVTSGANFLMGLGLYEDLMPRCPHLPDGSLQRLPDWLNDVAESLAGKGIAGADGWTGAPREDHKVLAWAINQVAGKTVNAFRTDLALDAIFFEVARGRPVIISGIFGQYLGKDGSMHDRAHVVCLTGMETDQDDVGNAQAIDLAQISAALVADPYGDFHTDYQVQQGAECRFSIAELMHILNVRDQAAKWAHVAALRIPSIPSASAVENEKTGAQL